MEENKKITRRRFIKGAVGLGALAALGGGFAALRHTSVGRDIKNQARSLLQDKQTQYIRQMVTADNNTTRTVMWQSDTLMTSPQLRLRHKSAGSSDDEISIPVKKDFFTDDGAEIKQYSANIDGLKPNTEYEFAIEDGDNISKWFTLDTAYRDKEKFTMLIFPDSQSSDYTDWENVAQAAIKAYPQAEIFTNMGDLVDNGEDSSQWRAWFGALHGIMDKLVFVPVMGNHECYDRNWKERLPEAYLHYFQVPTNGSTEFDRYYYSFDYGQVHFVVLNTMEEEIKNFKTGLIEEQTKWLHKDLQNTDKPWKIVLMHRDVLQYRISRMPERKEGFSEDGLIFMPIFEEYGVDIVFTAHLHTYRNRGHIVQGEHNAKGPLYILTGVAGNVRYDNLWTDHALDLVVAPQPETDNYIAMEVDGRAITISCFLPDGTKLDEIKVNK